MENFGDTTIEKKAEMATDAFAKLDMELIELPIEDITTETAPFIGGLLLARQVENSLLDAEDVGGETGSSDEDKEYIASFMSQLAEAQKGNFLPMKKFLMERAEGARGILDEYEEGSQDYKDFLNQSVRFKMLSELIPPTGDGSHIKLPNPAHMEKPVPLKIQIDRFKAGGEIR